MAHRFLKRLSLDSVEKSKKSAHKCYERQCTEQNNRRVGRIDEMMLECVKDMNLFCESA